MSNLRPRTDTVPALAAWDNGLILAYKGMNTTEIWWTRYQNGRWTYNEPIVTYNSQRPRTDNSPGFGLTGEVATLVFRGMNTADIYIANYNGSDWYGNVSLAPFRTSLIPAVASIGGRTCLTFKDELNNGLTLAWNQGGDKWMHIDPITVADQTVLTEASPAIAPFGNKFLIIFRGSGTTDLYYVVYDPSDPYAGSAFNGNLPVSADGWTARSDTGPCAAAFQDKVYIAFKGTGSTDLYYCWYDGTWHGNQRISVGQTIVQSDVQPTLASSGDRLYLAFKGRNTTDIWWCQFDGTSWAGNEPIDAG